MKNHGNMKMSSRHDASDRKPTGRPRRLTLEQVVDAALALGLERLSMSAVARSLGVSMTVLYGYISSREELVRLAATQLNRKTALVINEGQHWSIYIAQVAVTLASFLNEPGHLAHYLSGGFGPEVEIDRAESWLEKMTCCGFTAAEAVIIHRQVGEIVVGGAVSDLHARALERAGRPYREAALSAMAARQGTIPLLASEQDTFAGREPVWPRTLLLLLEKLAEARGEMLDREAIGDIVGRALQ
jgi:AcrR family transcriptional regulator